MESEEEEEEGAQVTTRVEQLREVMNTTSLQYHFILPFITHVPYRSRSVLMVPSWTMSQVLKRLDHLADAIAVGDGKPSTDPKDPPITGVPIAPRSFGDVSLDDDDDVDDVDLDANVTNADDLFVESDKMGGVMNTPGTPMDGGGPKRRHFNG